MLDNNNPGTTPPIKTLLIDTPAVTPYIINGRLGGNRRPTEPDTVIRPKENDLLYPSFNSMGSKSPPNANIVTPDPPVSAVKNPHKRTINTGVPPGIQPNKT